MIRAFGRNEASQVLLPRPGGGRVGQLAPRRRLRMLRLVPALGGSPESLVFGEGQLCDRLWSASCLRLSAGVWQADRSGLWILGGRQRRDGRVDGSNHAPDGVRQPIWTCM